MTTVTQLQETAQRVLIDVSETMARTSGFTKRKSKLTGPAFVQTLALGWLAHPQATLEELAQMAGALGVSIRPQSLDERFTKDAATFLQAVLGEAVRVKIEAETATQSLLSRFEGVYAFDASQIVLPAALSSVWRGNGRREPKERTEAAVKLSVGFDLRRGRLLGPELADGKMHDFNADLTATVLPKGSLRLADLGYFKLAELVRQDRMGVYWLSRFQTKCGFLDASGRAWELDAFLASRTESPAEDRLDLSIQLGLTERLPCRLLALRVPLAVAEERRRKLRQRAKGRGHSPSRKELTLCDWTVYVTNASSDLLSLPEAFVAGKLRWQIELLFKLWKSQLFVDDWRSEKPWRILCELYAKLIGALLQHWLLVVTAWEAPDRSLVKASRTIRHHISLLAAALLDPAQSNEWNDRLNLIRRCLQYGCRLTKRRSLPSSFQLLCNSELLTLT